MSEQRHHGPHPDADQLNAFVEGVLNEQAREESLAHLAECAECRSVVFLAQTAVPRPPDKKPAVAPRRWMLSFALAGAVVATALLIALWMRPHPIEAPARHEVAVAKPPASAPPSPPAKTLEPEVHHPPATVQLRREQSRPVAPSQPAHTAAAQEARPEGVIGGLSGRGTEPLVAETAPASQQPSPVPPPALSAPSNPGTRAPAGAALQTEANRAAAQPPAAPAASPQTARRLPETAVHSYSLRAERNMLSVRIEHDHDTVDGLSEVRGTVTDPSGAVVPGATISLLRSANTASAVTTTGADGGFTLAGVVPGQYELHVSARGFMTETLRLDLHARDLALLTPVLKVGAVTQTVAVAADSPALATASASIDAELAEIVPALPSKLAATTTAVRNGRMLALDQAGSLFLSRNAGRKWKKIRPVWPGAIAQLGLAETADSAELQPTEIKGKAAPLFRITTSTGAIWLSEDGAHWRPR